MSTKGNRENDITALDQLIDEITIDAYGDDEKLWAFRQAFEDDVNLPADGFVIGEPVSANKGTGTLCLIYIKSSAMKVTMYKIRS